VEAAVAALRWRFGEAGMQMAVAAVPSAAKVEAAVGNNVTTVSKEAMTALERMQAPLECWNAHMNMNRYTKAMAEAWYLLIGSHVGGGGGGGAFTQRRVRPGMRQRRGRHQHGYVGGFGTSAGGRGWVDVTQ